MCGFAAPLMRLMRLKDEVHGPASDYLRLAALAKREVAERANLINNEERTGYANL